MSAFRMGNAECRANQDFEEMAQGKLDVFWRTQGVTVDRSRAGRDFDAVYTDNNGQRWTVEEKFFRCATARADTLLLEIVQALEGKDWGWFVKTPADRLVYVISSDDGSPIAVRVLRWPEFKRWYLGEYLPKKPSGTYVRSGRGYGMTINLSIPVRDIPNTLYSFFKVEHTL